VWLFKRGAGGSLNKNSSFFCSLRQYRGLKTSGYSVTEKKVTYRPFRLSMSFKELQPENMNCNNSCPLGTFLLITAVPVHSVYKGMHFFAPLEFGIIQNSASFFRAVQIFAAI